MTRSPERQAAPVTRRVENRRATIAEIKQLARRQLVEGGPGALSLRGIAREMRTASSALYRYFSSHEELVSELISDAYTSLADTLSAARDDAPRDDPARQWWAISHAYRRWALANRADFALIFGTPIPGYRAPEQITGPAAGRSMAILLQVYAAAVRDGAADPDRTEVLPSIQPGELLALLAGDSVPGCPPRHGMIVLSAWVSLLGHLVGEIFGSLDDLVADTDQLYRAHVRTVMLGMGFDPSRVDAIRLDEADLSHEA
jgi:AcrR family transcriptional regulator